MYMYFSLLFSNPLPPLPGIFKGALKLLSRKSAVKRIFWPDCITLAHKAHTQTTHPPSSLRSSFFYGSCIYSFWRGERCSGPKKEEEECAALLISSLFLRRVYITLIVALSSFSSSFFAWKWRASCIMHACRALAPAARPPRLYYSVARKLEPSGLHILRSTLYSLPFHMLLE